MKSVPVCFAALIALGACNNSKNPAPHSGAATANAAGSAAAPAASGAGSAPVGTSNAVAEVQRRNSSITEEQIQRATNPQNEPPYKGPTGSVRGVVKIKGDPSPELYLAGIPLPTSPKCAKARDVYKSAYREGEGRTLADVLVAVTQYKGFLPTPLAPVNVDLSGCAFDTRTIAMMFGQTIAVKIAHGEAGAPDLLGARNPALLVAVPGGDPVELQPRGVGLDRLVDRSHEYTFADVYVLPYPTAQVTGLDGRFSISGIPVGPAKLNAMLPATGDTLEREVVISADKPLELGVLEFTFDAAKYEVALAAQKAKVKPADPKELADRQARARELAGNLAKYARSAATTNQSPELPPASTAP